MYHHPGEYVTDFCIVRRQDVYHLFHIRGERWTWPDGYREIDLGHATSTDLRLWTPHEPVLPAGPPGAWDEAGVWAPDILEAGGVYYLFYTGSDAKVNQKIGLATSSDLFYWTKHPHNPVVAPGPWSDRERGERVAGRDAMVFADTVGERYLLYYTATLADGRPCLALAQSRDLLHWEDLGPTYIEEDPAYNRCESAYLVRHGDRYYLFYSAKGGPQSKGHSPHDFSHFDIVYLVSDDPTGGWTKPSNHELLAGWTCASEHPTFDGTTYMFYVVQEELEGVWGASLLSDPKVIAWQPDGTVRVREHVPDNVGRRTLFSDRRHGYAGWVAQGGEWGFPTAEQVHSPPTDQDACWMNPLWGRDLVLEAEIRAGGAGAGSLLVRSNPSGTSGYRISLDFARGRVGFYLRVFGRADALIQERAVGLQAGAWHKLKVVVQDQFFDVYVDETLAIVRAHRAYEDGCFGLHARGAVAFRHVHAYEHLGPERIAGASWRRRCLPRHLFPSP